MTLLILDGYNLIHRAKGGFQKGDWPVVFNFMRGLKPWIEKYDPDRAVLVLEGSPQRALSELSTYKGNRSAATDDFNRQREMVIQLLQRLPIALAHHPAFEADDVILHLVIKAIAAGEKRIIVVSSDSDFTQLLQLDARPIPVIHDTDVIVHNWRDKCDLTRPDFDYVLWKALRGDPTDNVPRCTGVTEASAMVLANDPIILSKRMNDAVFQKELRRNLEIIRLKDLSDDDTKELSITEGVPDWEWVRQRFVEFDFKSMLKEPSWSRYRDAFKRLNNRAVEG